MKRSTGDATAAAPGVRIKECLESFRMTQKELAARTGASEKNLCMLVQGKAPLTPQSAKKLEMVFGVGAESWLMMESLYRSSLLKREYESGIEEDGPIACKLDYPLLSRLGWVPRTDDRTERIMNLRRFFEVSSLMVINTLKFTNVSCLSRDKAQGKVGMMRLAWCQQARIEARKQKLARYNPGKFRQSLSSLRKIACTARPDLGRLSEALNSLGAALIVMPCLPEAGIVAASFPAGNTVVIAMSGSFGTAYDFALRFFFEAGRISSGDFDADGTAYGNPCPALEFAHGQLVPPADFMAFARKGDFTEEAVEAFAREQGVDPGIIAGRLRSEGRVQGKALLRFVRPFEV